MADTGTGTDPTADRCPDCGHPYDIECECSCCMVHRIHTGTRDMRCADGAHRPMYFARCACDWEGPSRIERSSATQDGEDHLAVQF